MRYLSAFFLTSLLYVALATAFLFAIPFEKAEIKNKKEKKKISLNYVQVIKPKVVEVVKKSEVSKKIEEVKLEKKFIKKVAPKQIKKVLAKKKIKKIIKKREEKKKIVKKVLPQVIPKFKQKIKQKVVKNELPEPKKEPIVKNTTIQKPQKQINYKEDFLEKNLVLIKKQIQKYVKYSKRARKMNIQGEVLVEFCITKDGKIRDIKALSGHKLLRKSTIKAIYQASSNFPLVQKSITIKIPIAYRLL